jgi:hypothetical protein
LLLAVRGGRIWIDAFRVCSVVRRIEAQITDTLDEHDGMIIDILLSVVETLLADARQTTARYQ